MNMNIFKWLLVLTYLLWAVVIVLAFLNPSIESLIPVIVCSTGVIVSVVVTKDD